MSRFACVLLLLAVVAILSCTASAQDKSTARRDAKRRPADKSKYAAATIGEVDEDFAFQGEFMGPVSPGPFGADRVGLQVVALGDASFEAVLLRGGLPGAGWDRYTQRKLAGTRQEKYALLSDGQLHIWIDENSAIMEYSGGPTLGQIPRIHRVSPSQDSPPAASAVALFDGSGTAHFRDAKITPDGCLGVGAITKAAVQDFQMHLEFRTPYMPYARGQSRGNSGVYIQQRYEVQILDSFGLSGAENECGGLYKQMKPAVNMCLPPLSWQTYDIYFTAARWWTNGRKAAPARITVLHNGEPIHSNYELQDKTGGGKPEGPQAYPILLQNHGNPVSFRNVWLNSWYPYPDRPFEGPFDLWKSDCFGYSTYESVNPFPIRHW